MKSRCIISRRYEVWRYDMSLNPIFNIQQENKAQNAINIIEKELAMVSNIIQKLNF